jgi:hypothetical protein
MSPRGRTRLRGYVTKRNMSAGKPARRPASLVARACHRERVCVSKLFKGQDRHDDRFDTDKLQKIRSDNFLYGSPCYAETKL